MLKFKDADNWLTLRMRDVRRMYRIPADVGGEVAVDVGANVGAFAIVNANRFNRILCFEPSAYSVDQCRNNTKHLNNVEVYRLAVSDSSGKMLRLKAYKHGNVSGNASTIESDMWDDKDYEEVDSVSLEDVFTNYNISRIDYLKVDCEGGEYDFLMNKDLSNISYMGIEIHIQLGRLAEDLYRYLLCQFDVIASLNDGIRMHRILTLKNKAV
jgi:FkbM family methyltransferase